MPVFDDKGLIPAIIQHARSGEVLMLGYMNEEALHLTLERGLVTFWSRSRSELWQKGSTSGHVLKLIEVRQDCDGDALLVLVEPAGPTCHTGQPSCFHHNLLLKPVAQRAPMSTILTQVIDVVQSRRQEQTSTSYTVKLLQGGVDRIGKKIGEEAAEVIIAAKNDSAAELTYEVADLIYHTIVLLEHQGVSLETVWAELQRRANA
jgi:phosphoribosyl-ATP pyrophosphohydrolase/phosphoribosyl-AMP cyclohydrolase